MILNCKVQPSESKKSDYLDIGGREKRLKDRGTKKKA